MNAYLFTCKICFDFFIEEICENDS